MTAVILHVDMDAFFAAVEQRDEPSCQGKPVIVGADPEGGRGRGVVAACSYEARSFGIHSAQPISHAYRLCPEGIYLPPNGRLYRSVSAAIMKILEDFSHLVEPISIDEAFLDVSGSARLLGSPPEIALEIKDRIRREQHLTASIGVAPSKFLAKIASDLEKPDGLVVVDPGHEKKFLADLPVRRIWGVGPKTEARLKGLGIQTIGEVALRSKEYWARQLGRQGIHLWKLSQGQDNRKVVRHQRFKSLSHERTFLEDTADPELISSTLLYLSEEVSRRCRQHAARGRCITLKWRYADFSTLSRQVTLGQPTNDPLVVYRAVWRLVEELQPFPQRIRLVGVALSRFEESHNSQLTLFEQMKPPRRRDDLNSSIDLINQKFGRGKIKKASLFERRDDDDEGFSSFLSR